MLIKMIQGKKGGIEKVSPDRSCLPWILAKHPEQKLRNCLPVSKTWAPIIVSLHTCPY